jgi:hypothetical protein
MGPGKLSQAVALAKAACCGTASWGYPSDRSGQRVMSHRSKRRSPNPYFVAVDPSAEVTRSRWDVLTRPTEPACLGRGTTSEPTRLTTVLSGSGHFGDGRVWWLGDFLTIFSGASATDSATLSGANASTAGGTVTYTVYSYDSWGSWGFGHKSSVAGGGTFTVANGAVPNSNPVTLPQGLYVWQVSYSGDSLNASSMSQWDSEVEFVVPVPSCNSGWTWGFNGGCRSQGNGYGNGQGNGYGNGSSDGHWW